MHIRRAHEDDLSQILDLYQHLKGKAAPEIDGRITAVWRSILSDPNHYLLAGVVDGAIVSTCVMVVVPNLTHDQHPYAFIENVVTLPGHRGKGYATAVLSRAREIAAEQGCYKIMLMTGSKKESTLGFYERAGYNKRDKTAFIQWL